MYNEEKKLISGIARHKDLDNNLPLYINAMKKADYEYACQKFSLNYFTVKEMLEDDEIADDPYIYEAVLGINKLTNKYLVEQNEKVEAGDLELINNIRDKVTAKMKVLTAYTDAFELYEYILNRKEYGFLENCDEEVDEDFINADMENFSAEIFNYIFSDHDNVVVNSKIQSVVGQLPIRMTKNRFYDIIGQTLSIYKGLEIGSVTEFVDTILANALIQLPEGFETEYEGLFKAYEKLKSQDYSDLTYDSYRQLSQVLDNSAMFINDVVSDYLMIIEVVNDLYAMMLSTNDKDQLSEDCNNAISVISMVCSALLGNEDIPEDSYELLMKLEGAQEKVGECKMVLEAACFDIESGNSQDIIRLGLQDEFKNIDMINKLLSGSMFVDIHNMSMYNTALCDTEFIVSMKNKVNDHFANLFAANKMNVNRAIMAKTLSTIPVFFNNQQEIKEYIEGALAHCSNEAELKASYRVIKAMIEEQ